MTEAAQREVERRLSESLVSQRIETRLKQIPSGLSSDRAQDHAVRNWRPIAS
jgi:hypothetical protein